MTPNHADHARCPSRWARRAGPLAAACLWASLSLAGRAAGQEEHHPVTPEALQVDPPPATSASDGNGVFEPGERVVTAPAWRNVSPSPILLRGTASNFTGPSVAIYTIFDNSANYGVIPAGRAASCLGDLGTAGNCYGMAVDSVGASRPTHWDSTFKERTNTNTTHVWTLHLGDSFADVPRSSPFYRFVETALHKGLTGGCGGGLYCPEQPLTREQATVFLLVAKEGPGYAPPACVPGAERFIDVPASSPFCRFVEEAARRNILGGCGPDAFCPGDPVARQQLADIVLFTREGEVPYPPCFEGTARIFADVDHTNPFCPEIEELARRGVVGGCAPGLFCPLQNAARDQAAVFVVGTFELKLYEP